MEECVLSGVVCHVELLQQFAHHHPPAVTAVTPHCMLTPIRQVECGSVLTLAPLKTNKQNVNELEKKT